MFIDTLNRSLVGSESKDEDMAQYLAAAGAIEERLQCLVAIVHHCGIDRDRPRGHSSLSAAVEVQIRVDRIGDLQATITVELAKDFPEGTEIFYRLEAVNVGTDPDGDPITSLVVLSPEESGPAPERRKTAKGLGSEQRNALTALAKCVAVLLSRAVPLQLPSGFPPASRLSVSSSGRPSYSAATFSSAAPAKTPHRNGADSKTGFSTRDTSAFATTWCGARNDRYRPAGARPHTRRGSAGGLPSCAATTIYGSLYGNGAPKIALPEWSSTPGRD